MYAKICRRLNACINFTIFCRWVRRRCYKLEKVSEREPNRAKRDPKSTKMRKWSPKDAKRKPKGSQRTPKVSQRVPKGSQGEPKGNQREPKGSQKWAKGRPKCIKKSTSGKGRENDGFLVVRPGTFWTSFGAIFHQKSMKKSMRKSMPKKSWISWKIHVKFRCFLDWNSLKNR